MLIPQLPKLAVRPLLPGFAPQVFLSEVADAHLHVSVSRGGRAEIQRWRRGPALAASILSESC